MIWLFLTRWRHSHELAHWDDEPLWRRRRDQQSRPRWTFAMLPLLTKIILVLLLFSFVFIIAAFIGLAVIAALSNHVESNVVEQMAALR